MIKCTDKHYQTIQTRLVPEQFLRYLSDAILDATLNMDSDEEMLDAEIFQISDKGKGKAKATDQDLPADNDNLPW